MSVTATAIAISTVAASISTMNALSAPHSLSISWIGMVLAFLPILFFMMFIVGLVLWIMSGD